MKFKFDLIDRKILEMLIDDGRQSLTQISKEIAMSNSGIKKRVSKLNKSGVLKIQGNFNLEAMEFKACVILLEIKNFEFISKIIKAYKSCPYVFLVAEILSSFNLMIGFFGNSDQDLNNKLKLCGPSNKEGVLHSKTILISDFKFPQFLPLHLSFRENEDIINNNSCGYKCIDCVAFIKNECKGCC
ncbi:MAG: winged helix-turn-helix transcriptional regulator [Candidatus Lokiarchaeota archaeon]|nr:winged helix-turn-helix transcriptional regulator [Candidatus Lokiarchaeota archaeon]